MFQATREFIEKVNAKFRRKLGPVTWSVAVRFLFARKFDVARALALFEQHELTRQREGLTRFDPTSEPLHSELLTGKFTILVSFGKIAFEVFGPKATRLHKRRLSCVLYYIHLDLSHDQRLFYHDWVSKDMSLFLTVTSVLRIKQ